MDLRKKAKTIKENVPLIYLCLKDKRCPFIAKVFSFLTVAYFLSPIDLLPDFVPVIGYLDDLIVLPSLIFITIKMIPKDLFESKRNESLMMWDKSKEHKWIYSVPILTFWILIIIWVVIWIRKI